MKKQSLIHIHQLLAIVQDAVTSHNETPPDAFDAYVQYGVRPTHIHRSKDQHKEAIWLLLEGINRTIGETPPMPAD